MGNRKVVRTSTETPIEPAYATGNPAGQAAYEKALQFAREVERYAKTANAPIWNILDQTTKTNPTYTMYTKEDIIGYMQRPASNEKYLRNASIYMYDASSQYRRLIQYYALLLKWVYTVQPLSFDPTKVKEENFRRQYQKVMTTLENMNLQHELQKASMIALRDGVLYGAVWSTNMSFYIQRINPDICSLTSINDGTWMYSVDMSQISEKQLILYPPEFTTMWNAYRSSGQKWQEVPESISFCLKADETNVAYSIPPWCSTLPMLYDIETFKSLQETATKIANYKLLAMKIELNDDGAPTVDWDLAKQYYRQLCNVLPPYVGATVSPMKIESFEFDKSGGTQDVDTVSRAENQFWSETGTSRLIHGSDDNNTAGALKLSIRTDEELMFGMMSQAQRLINRILKNMSGTVKFKIEFLPITIFNEDEKAAMYKDAATLGIPGSKLAYAATIGMKQVDLPGLSFIENTIIDCGSWMPLQSGYTGGGTTSASGDDGGRPPVDDVDLGEAGEKTRDAGSNDNR